MFLDARQVGEGNTIDADICIIGAGPVGITLAMRLATSGRRICLLESGGLEPSEDAQALNEAKSVGHKYSDIGSTRLRYFGGTSNHWEGFCGILQTSDFEERSGVPNSGWPLQLDDLRSYYSEAQGICQIDRISDDNRASWPAPTSASIEALDHTKLTTSLIQKSPPVRFGLEYRMSIERSREIRCFLWANTIELKQAEQVGRVDRAVVATLAGKRFYVSAGLFILACGAIENARILLNSGGKDSNGLGNDADLVGRFFMEHPVYRRVAHIVPTDLGASLPWSPTGRNFHALTLAPQLLHERGGIGMAFYAEAMESAQKVVMQEALKALGRGRLPEDFPHHLLTLMENRREAARAILNALPVARRAAKRIRTNQPLIVDALAEQSPNRESRIVLVRETDALGQRRVALDWRIRAQDVADVRRATEYLGAELRRQGLGACQVLLDTDSDTSVAEDGQMHQMGTTRMSDNSATGVVDRNCRVFSTDNLYVAGGSVFPTSGWINPTLTIIALSLRLADHITANQ